VLLRAFGCVETWLSGPALSLDHWRHHGESLTAEAVGARAGAGDLACQCVTAALRTAPGQGAGAGGQHLDPDVIVLGGGLSNLERLYEAVPMLWAAHVFSDVVRTRLLRNVHGDSSGVRGCRLALDEALRWRIQ
jgi:fructokinase